MIQYFAVMSIMLLVVTHSIVMYDIDMLPSTVILFWHGEIVEFLLFNFSIKRFMDMFHFLWLMQAWKNNVVIEHFAKWRCWKSPKSVNPAHQLLEAGSLKALDSECNCNSVLHIWYENIMCILKIMQSTSPCSPHYMNALIYISTSELDLPQRKLKQFI